MNDSNFLILSCDGGGIRGLITAMIIQELDKQIPFLNQIDLFAGTSTGGIIALGLASGVPISQLVDIYGSSGNCSQIFDPYKPQSARDPGFLERFIKELDKSEEFAGIAGIINKIDQLLYVKYDNTGLKTVLENNLTQPSKPLAKLNRKVLVTTFELDNTSDENNPSWRPITLDNLPDNKFQSQDTLTLDAALCTSAAPTYNRLRNRLRNLIDELHHKVAKFLTENFDVILLPTFEVSEMVVKNSRKIRSKSVRQMLNWSHYRFKEFLKHKAFETGKLVIDCCEAYTSKTVSWTGELVQNLGGKKVIKSQFDNKAMDRDRSGRTGKFSSCFGRYTIT